MRYESKLGNPNFTVENIDILNVSRPKGYKHHHHSRAKHAFIYTVSGAMCDVFLGGQEQTIYALAGELVFIPKDCDYFGVYSEDSTEIKIIQFDIIGEQLPSYLQHPQKIDFPKITKQIENIFKPLKANEVSHQFYYLSRIYELLWLIDENYSKIPSKYKRLQVALSEISEFYNRNEKIAYYASLCDMSEVNFRRLFHEYTGQSPIEYRNDIRLNNAKIKLQSGLYNVSEAAESSGFTNLSFFTRLYKKKFGYTPKKE